LIRNKKALILNDYHGWFENLVGDWIDVAASKCNLEIKRAVTALDKVKNFYLLYLKLTNILLSLLSHELKSIGLR